MKIKNEEKIIPKILFLYLVFYLINIISVKIKTLIDFSIIEIILRLILSVGIPIYYFVNISNNKNKRVLNNIYFSDILVNLCLSIVNFNLSNILFYICYLLLLIIVFYKENYSKLISYLAFGTIILFSLKNIVVLVANLKYFNFSVLLNLILFILYLIYLFLAIKYFIKRKNH